MKLEWQKYYSHFCTWQICITFEGANLRCLFYQELPQCVFSRVWLPFQILHCKYILLPWHVVIKVFLRAQSWIPPRSMHSACVHCGEGTDWETLEGKWNYLPLHTCPALQWVSCASSMVGAGLRRCREAWKRSDWTQWIWPTTQNNPVCVSKKKSSSGCSKYVIVVGESQSAQGQLW